MSQIIVPEKTGVKMLRAEIDAIKKAWRDDSDQMCAAMDRLQDIIAPLIKTNEDLHADCYRFRRCTRRVIDVIDGKMISSYGCDCDVCERILPVVD